MTRVLVVPAAGLGTRLGGGRPKLLVEVAGRPMIDHVLAAQGRRAAGAVLVIHPSFREAVERHFAGRSGAVTLVEQPAPTGMLDAILLAREAVARAAPDRVWITWCDQIGISETTLRALDAWDRAAEPPAAAFPTAVGPHPYIHFDRDAAGTLVGVRQRREGDTLPDVGEGDAGLFSLSTRCYAEALPAYAAAATPGPVTGERAFLPFLPWVARRDRVVTFPVREPIEALGVNTPADLDRMDRHLAARRPQA